MIKIRGVKSSLNPKHLFANLKDGKGNTYAALFRFKNPIQENMVIDGEEGEIFNFLILGELEKPFKEDYKVTILKTNKLSKNEFINKFCNSCGTQRCGGLGMPESRFCHHALLEYFDWKGD